MEPWRWWGPERLLYKSAKVIFKKECCDWALVPERELNMPVYEEIALGWLTWFSQPQLYKSDASGVRGK
jgi:hypothetical protein